MDTSTFDALTEAKADTDRAAGFLASRVAIGALGGAAHDPEILDRFFADRVPPAVAWHAKAAIAPGSTTDSTWGAPLAQPSAEQRAFLGLVDRVSPLGQIGGIRVDGNVMAAIQVSGGTASWAGESSSKPVTSLAFSSHQLTLAKLIAQIIMSAELAGLGRRDALAIVQRVLVTTTAAAEGTALFDANAATTARPAGLLNGVVATAAGADLPDSAGKALDAISGGDATRPVVIVSRRTATRMGTLVRDLRDVGVKVVISAAAGTRLIAVDADGLLVWYGAVEIVTGTPDVQMDSAPDDPPTSGTVLISTWQRNLVAVKVERWVTWFARPGAVAFVNLV